MWSFGPLVYGYGLLRIRGLWFLDGCIGLIRSVFWSQYLGVLFRSIFGVLKLGVWGVMVYGCKIILMNTLSIVLFSFLVRSIPVSKFSSLRKYFYHFIIDLIPTLIYEPHSYMSILENTHYFNIYNKVNYISLICMSGQRGHSFGNGRKIIYFADQKISLFNKLLSVR